MQTLPLSPPKTNKTSQGSHSAPIANKQNPCAKPPNAHKQGKTRRAKHQKQQATNSKERINANTATTTHATEAKSPTRMQAEDQANTLIQRPEHPVAAAEYDHAHAKYYTDEHWVLAPRARSPTLTKSTVLEDLSMLTIHRIEQYPFYLRLRDIATTLAMAKRKTYGTGMLVTMQRVLRRAYANYYVPLDTALALVEWEFFDGLPTAYEDEVRVFQDDGSLPTQQQDSTDDYPTVSGNTSESDGLHDFDANPGSPVYSAFAKSSSMEPPNPRAF